MQKKTEESWKKKSKKKGESWKKIKTKWKKKWNALWIIVVIHVAFGCEETVVSPHPLVICIMWFVIIFEFWEN